MEPNAEAVGLCPDGKYRGCDFMGCDDLVSQRIETGRRFPLGPCRRTQIDGSASVVVGGRWDDQGRYFEP